MSIDCNREIQIKYILYYTLATSFPFKMSETYQYSSLERRILTKKYYISCFCTSIISFSVYTRKNKTCQIYLYALLAEPTIVKYSPRDLPTATVITRPRVHHSVIKIPWHFCTLFLLHINTHFKASIFLQPIVLEEFEYTIILKQRIGQFGAAGREPFDTNVGKYKVNDSLSYLSVTHIYLYI